MPKRKILRLEHPLEFFCTLFFKFQNDSRGLRHARPVNLDGLKGAPLASRAQVRAPIEKQLGPEGLASIWVLV